jgi:hypothetical protein
MKRQIVLSLCGAALLLAAVSIGSGQSASTRGRTVDSRPSSGPAKERSFRLRVTTMPARSMQAATPTNYLFEKTYTAMSTDKGKALPTVIQGHAQVLVYSIIIDWPDNQHPDLAVRFYDYQVSKMTKPAKDRKPPMDKLYLGKGNLQLLPLKNKEEGDKLIQEAVALIVKDVTFRMSFWDELAKKNKP